MNPFLQAITGRNITPTAYDAAFLKSQQPLGLEQKQMVGTDYLGRINPIQMVGNSAINWSGKSKGTLTRDGYSANHTGYAIQNFILVTAKPLPWNAYKLTVADNKKKIVPNHPLANLLYRPNPKQSWSEFKTEAEANYLITGNAYIWALRAESGINKGKAVELWVLPAWTEVLGGGYLQEVTGYRVQWPDGKVDSYNPEDVVHIKTFNPECSRYGLSPVTACYKAFTAADSSLNARVKQLLNLGPPGILFNKDKDFQWSPEQATGMQTWFRRFFTGRRQDNQIPVLTNEVGYVQLGLNSVDLDIIKGLQADRDMIADAFRFPNQLLNGNNSSTFTNVESARKALYTNCIIPLETELRDGLNKLLGKDYDDKVYLDFDLSQIPELQEDKSKLITALDSCTFIKQKDKQRLCGLEVDETQDFYLLPSKMVRSDVVPIASTATQDAA